MKVDTHYKRGAEITLESDLEARMMLEILRTYKADHCETSGGDDAWTYYMSGQAADELHSVIVANENQED